MLQRQRVWQCKQFHQSLLQQLCEHWLSTEVPSSDQPANASDRSDVFGCMLCQRRFRSQGGEGAHMFRKHGQVNPVRHLFATTQCGGCLKEYYTHGKLKAHLCRSAACRSYLLEHGGRHLPAPGLGSADDQARHQALDSRHLPQQAMGPLCPVRRLRDLPDVDWALHDQLAETLLDFDPANSLDLLMSTLREQLTNQPLAWTHCRRLLLTLLSTIQDEQGPIGSLSGAQATQVVQQLIAVDSWPFLRHDLPTKELSDPPLALLENQCIDVTLEPSPFVPRCIGRERVFLHAYSGRRRPGDIQFYLEAIQSQQRDGTLLHVVSLDLMTDPVWGDATKPATQQFWRRGVATGIIVGFLAGPPCETWSQARFIQLPDAASGPRPLRADDALWGLDALSIRELEQILTGNALLFFALDMMLRLYFAQSCGVLEHPEAPLDPSKPSIWRLPVMSIFRKLPGFHEISFSQGLLGAISPKPTRLLCLNMPQLQTALRSHHITAQLPKKSSIGRCSDGTFATGYLKEYPPAMSRALAVEFHRCFRDFSFDPKASPDSEFLSRCQAMNVQEFTAHIGQDYSAR